MKDYYFVMQKKPMAYMNAGKIRYVDKKAGNMSIKGFQWMHKNGIRFKPFLTPLDKYIGNVKDSRYEEHDVDKDVYTQQTIRYIFEEM